jgi:hypothetical protein
MSGDEFQLFVEAVKASLVLDHAVFVQDRTRVAWHRRGGEPDPVPARLQGARGRARRPRHRAGPVDGESVASRSITSPFNS